MRMRIDPERPGPAAVLLTAFIALVLMAGCGLGGADSRPGARYFRIDRPNAATAADIEAYLRLPTDHRTATQKMRALGARCETSEMLIRIDDNVLCRYGQGTSFFENKVWKIGLNVDDDLVVRSVTVDSWRSSTIPVD